jgi:TRAP-type C4-dicarboxylate transport system substrate-binding protein
MEMYGKFPQLQAEWKGVKLLGYHQLYPYILASRKKEVYLPEHFKGMKVGGTGAKMKLVSNAGGADVNQVPPDAYMNLDKGVADACFISWGQSWDYHLSEVARYFYDFSFSGGGFGIIMNLDAWNAMSGDDQKIFMEVLTRALEMGEDATYGDEEKGMKAAKDSGAIVRKPTDTEVAAWRKAAAPIIGQWIADAKKLGAKDPEAILDEWQRLLQAHKE